MFFKQDNSLFSWLHFGLWPLSLAKPCFHSISSEPQRMNKLARTHAYSTNSRFYWHSYLVPAASSGKQPLIPSLDQKGQKGEGCRASFPMTPCLPVLTQSLRLKGWTNIGTAKKGTYGWVGGRGDKNRDKMSRALRLLRDFWLEKKRRGLLISSSSTTKNHLLPILGSTESSWLSYDEDF